MGNCEEEHAGGALVFRSYDLGEEFSGDAHVMRMGHSFTEMASLYGAVDGHQAGGLRDRQKISGHHLCSGNVAFRSAQAKGFMGRRRNQIAAGQNLRPAFRLQGANGKTAGANRLWRLVGFVAEGTLCHKPCTVSGGGKSEISKPITDAILTGPVFVADFKEDFDRVADVHRLRITKDRFVHRDKAESRPILCPGTLAGLGHQIADAGRRAITNPNTMPGSNPFPNTSRNWFSWSNAITSRNGAPNWREHFSVDIINGIPGNELKFDNRKIVTTYLRVGFDSDGLWRTFGLRKDFHPVDENSNGGRHHGIVTPVPRHPPESSLQVCQKLRDRNCSSARMTRFIAAMTNRPNPILRRADNFFSNYEPLPRNSRRN